MQIQHPFDFGRAVRGTRRFLHLRQAELAKEAGVGREWLVDFEHGKPTVSVGLAIRTLRTLGLEIYVHSAPEPPAWTVPLTKAAKVREALNDYKRPRGRVRKERPEVQPPGVLRSQRHEAWQEQFEFLHNYRQPRSFLIAADVEGESRLQAPR